jgi:pSer/pThr/pTyr-binding forkhead associated (FHA) protein
VNELQFSKSPVNIGRHADSQIHLAEKTVSRHHAVIYQTPDKKWILEDLDSTNKTYLNKKSIKKQELKDGDVIKINDFTIEVRLQKSKEDSDAVNLNDTLEKTVYGVESDSNGTSQASACQFAG